MMMKEQGLRELVLEYVLLAYDEKLEVDSLLAQALELVLHEYEDQLGQQVQELVARQEGCTLKVLAGEVCKQELKRAL